MTRKISVFIASPGDLAKERDLFRTTIDNLNEGFGDGAGVEFEALGWEDTLATTGRRNQSVINEEIDRCDVFILTLYRRWGQNAPDAGAYTSYTEEEFYRALSRLEKEDKPEIFVFFKRVDPESEADPGPQLEKVMAFRRQLEETRQVLYHYFDSDKSFIDEVNLHLRAYAKGDLPESDRELDKVLLPLSALAEVEKAKQEAKLRSMEAEQAHDSAAAALTKLEEMQLQMAEDAANLSKEGNIEFARQKFSKLIVESSNLRILYLAYEFYNRTGDVNSAFSALDRWLSLTGKGEQSAETAAAFGNLGNLYFAQGEIDRAEETYRNSLAIDEANGNIKGMALTFGNLGNCCYIRGELDKAEMMYEKSLAIDDVPSGEQCIFNQYGNLGNIYFTRGELDKAEEMYRKSLAIAEAKGNKGDIADQYGNLGNLFSYRGDLDKAEEMYQKSLAIDKAQGHQKGMASQYGNLGLLYKDRGELDKAEAMYKKSLSIYEAQGHKKGIALNYGNLGVLYLNNGDLKKAEAMHRKSLAINESLGHKEGIASQYANLGIIYGISRNFEQAAGMYRKSLDLFKEMSSPKAGVVEGWLSRLHEHAEMDT